MPEMKGNVFVRKGKIQEMDKSFDLKFWQAQSPKARFDAVWELIILAAKRKGQDVCQLRLQQSVVNYQRQSK